MHTKAEAVKKGGEDECEGFNKRVTLSSFYKGSGLPKQLPLLRNIQTCPINLEPATEATENYPGTEDVLLFILFFLYFCINT